MGRLLLDESPLVVIPELAVKVGLNESIILQQLHYWLDKSKHVKDGRRWVYNSYADWQEQFPFWSEATIKRTITKLENQGYILTGNYNKKAFDRTKWYTINYGMIYEPLDEVKMTRPSGQNDLSMRSKCTDDEVKMTPPIPETTTETTTEDIYTIFDHWNSKEIIQHRQLSQKLKSHINARLEKYPVGELMEAIDNYHTIITDDSYFFTYKWTLAEFLTRGLDKFLTKSKPFDNYRDKQAKKPTKKQPRQESPEYYDLYRS